MPIWIAKIIATRIIKAVKHKIDLKRIDKYVNKPNELDKQMKAVRKCLTKHSNDLIDIHKDITLLIRDSHPSQEYICCRKCGCKIAKSKIRK